ncbi:lysylphosphatidylglycerol synthase domain-containing protein [Roseomonas sp. E05]|uniref:lysylphosphatidylglycerol synthase domain-containing protein n=1 Tax=Roseomonas sp. E05 TaxID=3046310 RepID=UPI0024B91A6A|nr:lysylphosphatidylglycerol synthase domain-containing protein [Roseomonas sp. E05]MDJ0391103.1 lysylphosphatidylglycerol synthase domain-containing protein [Roseomonas sp. E05]
MIWSTGLSLLVGLSIAGALIAANEPAEILRLLLETGWGLLAVLALHGTQIVASALGWAPLIDDPRRPGALALVRMRWIRGATNALLPVVQAAGELVRAQLLIRKGVAKVKVIASIATDLGTEMATQIAFSLLGLATLLLIPHGGGGSTLQWAVIGTLLGAAVTGVFIAAQRWGLFRVVERLLPGLAARVGWTSVGELSGLHDTVVRLYRQPWRFWRSGGWHFASWLLGVLETWAALRILGIEAGLAEALVIESLGQAVRSAGFFIPGALGVQEGGYVLICALFGIPPERAIALVLVRRLRDVLLGIPGVIAWRWDVMAPRPATEPTPTEPLHER